MPLLRPSAAPPPRFRPVTVAEVAPVAEHAVSLAFDVSDPALADFLDYRAGQYVTLAVTINGERVRQSYSLWAPPSRARAEGRLHIAVAEIAGGRMSPWLASHVAAGDRIDLLPPRGEFSYAAQPGPARHVVIAGGSGITPVLAIMAEILAADPATEVDLVLANRTHASSVLREEVARLADSAAGRLRVVDVLSREVPGPSAPGTRHGRVDESLLDELLGEGAGEVDGWWLCGPEGLLEVAEGWLARRGVPGERVHRERFTTTGPVDPRPPVTPAQRRS
jgi:ring-1,2-phenylacetyl-CoA epoxidase subunit PaaE